MSQTLAGRGEAPFGNGASPLASPDLRRVREFINVPTQGGWSPTYDPKSLLTTIQLFWFLLRLVSSRFTSKPVALKIIYLALLIGVGGEGSICRGEEVIVLDKRKTEALAEWDKPVLFGKGDWKVVDDAGEQVIKLRTESSSFALEKSITVDLKRTPYLEWEWKVTVLPTGGNVASPEADDQAAQLLVVFHKTFFERRKVITYIWDPTAPKGTIAAGAGPIYLNVKAIVVESGYRQLDKWLIQKRNVLEDFRAVFGVTPERVVAIRLQINSQHTKSDAEAFWKTIRFTSERD